MAEEEQVLAVDRGRTSASSCTWFSGPTGLAQDQKLEAVAAIVTTLARAVTADALPRTAHPA